MKTTLTLIRRHAPCADGWGKLLRHLGKVKADDEPLSIATVLDSNGLDHALWCLRAVTGHDREIRLFAVWCARQIQHLMRDPRSIASLDVAERYANSEASDADLKAARSAGEEAAREASFNTGCDAARAAACSAWWAVSCGVTSRAPLAAQSAAWAATWASGKYADLSARHAVVDGVFAAARGAQAAELWRLCA